MRNGLWLGRALIVTGVLAAGAACLGDSDLAVPSGNPSSAQPVPARTLTSRANASQGVRPGDLKATGDGVLANYDAYAEAPTIATRPGRSDPALSVATRDPKRLVPSFVWVSLDSEQATARRAANFGPEDVALDFVRGNASTYGLSPLSLKTIVVRETHDTGRGAIIVSLGQDVDGVPVRRVRLAVAMTRDFDIVAASGNLHAAAVPATVPFALDRRDALATAVTDLTGTTVGSSAFQRTNPSASGRERYIAGRLGRRSFVTPATLAPTLFALPDQIVAAYEIEVDVARPGEPTPDAYAYVISAATGRILSRRNLTETDSFNYRVWAETSAPFTPLDGPSADRTPHPTGVPDPGFVLDFVDPSLVAIDGLNTNPSGASDPWLPSGAAESVGNNVDAYADLALPDGFSAGDLRASATAPGAFDRTFDTALAPNESPDQVMASVTQLFFVNNWLHDWFYDSGFDEAAGNAQLDNFGRGGLGGDPLRAEAQDSSGLNNANMATFAEGTPPRMQMFVWTGVITPVGETFLNITAPPAIARDYSAAEIQSAAFGPNDPTTAAANLILVDDGVDVGSDGCEPIVTDLTGAIALIDRGACAFVSKALNAQLAGAIGTVIVNNDAANPDSPPPLGGASPDVVTPVLGISLNNGAVIKAEQLAGSIVALDMGRAGQVEGTRRDGTIDNGIVAHEWGHYIHNRLTSCGAIQCRGTGEGWGDFIALYMALRDSDDLDGVFAASPYATLLLSPDPSYFGIRRFPYSVDTTRNALTFRHIQRGEPLPTTTPGNLIFSSDNAEVHNSGEIWASMLFEGYVALLKESRAPIGRLTFAEAQRRMADYVVGGLKLMPSNATFTEQRDAILAVAAANDLADLDVLARGFARRGAGTGAVSPPSDSADLVGVVESFVVSGDLAVTSIELTEAAPNCDGDGVLDAGETGVVKVTVMNTGVLEINDTTVAVSSTNAAVSFPSGSSVSPPAMAPLTNAVIEVAIRLDATLTGIQSIDLAIEAIDPGALSSPVTASSIFRVNFDDSGVPSASDDVESEHTTWTVASAPDIGANAPWVRTGDGLNHVWMGTNADSLADERLESPPLVVSTTESLVIRFDHRHSFEFDPFPVNWDGGVIEVTTDGGATWVDVSTFVDPGYGGVIGVIPLDPPSVTENPLAEREGFVAVSPGYPAFAELSLDFGAQLAGQTIQIRFRLGSDSAVGAPGWDIDNIDVSGITNLPFNVIGEHAGVCRPHADAGADQTVRSLSLVRLDGSGSTDLDGDNLRYRWRQVSGPRVFLFGRRTARPRFIAPLTFFRERRLSFELTVSDGQSIDADTVEVLVTPLFR